MCDISEIKKFLPRFISTSIYICSGKICFYGKKDEYDLEQIVYVKPCVNYNNINYIAVMRSK